MRYRDTQKRRTCKACIYAFLLTVCVLLTGIGFLAADCTTGRALHGSGYTGPSITANEQWMEFLPPRIRALLQIPAWEQGAARWAAEQLFPEDATQP